MSARPDPGPPFREGTYWVARSEPLWCVLDPAERRRFLCREGRCGAIPVAMIRGSAWCADHMDNRWIEKGVVMAWILVDDPRSAPLSLSMNPKEGPPC